MNFIEWKWIFFRRWENTKLLNSRIVILFVKFKTNLVQFWRAKRQTIRRFQQLFVFFFCEMRYTKDVMKYPLENRIRGFSTKNVLLQKKNTPDERGQMFSNEQHHRNSASKIEDFTLKSFQFLFCTTSGQTILSDLKLSQENAVTLFLKSVFCLRKRKKVRINFFSVLLS